MAWTAPKTFVANTTLTAAELNTHLRDNLLETCPATATTAGDIIYADAANSMGSRLALGAAGTTLVSSGSAPVWRLYRYATSVTAETTASTSYVDYGSPAHVQFSNITTGTRAVVWFNARVSNNTAGAITNVSVRVSGDSTIAASDNWRASHESSAANDQSMVASFNMFSTLTAGNNTFTLTFRAGTNTAQVHQASMMMLAIS